MGTLRVLFVCTHNSARSQMAEGFLREYGAGRFEVFSAGTEATAVRPEAIDAMTEHLAGCTMMTAFAASTHPLLGSRLAWRMLNT